MSDPFPPGDTPEEQAARREANARLREAARRAGMSLEKLGALLRQVARNESETRRFLSDVYGVPDEKLDNLLRERLARLDAEKPEGEE